MNPTLSVRLPSSTRQTLALLHHSDRGSQYTSEQFQPLMADHGVTYLMTRSGNAWDNRREIVLLVSYQNRNVWVTRKDAWVVWA